MNMYFFYKYYQKKMLFFIIMYVFLLDQNVCLHCIMQQII